MNKSPFIKILNKVLFDNIEIDFEKQESILLSNDFLSSVLSLSEKRVVPYWIEQIEIALKSIHRLERTTVFQETFLNHDLIGIALMKTAFGVYPEHIRVENFDFTTDGYDFIFKNSTNDVITFLTYEVVFKCIYYFDFNNEGFLSKEKYNQMCDAISLPYSF